MKTLRYLLFVTAVGLSFGQARSTIDLQKTDALLRGSWEFHTYRQRWTIEFETDHTLTIDRQTSKYQIFGDTIAIRSDEGITKYRYKLDNHRLSLTSSDGKTMTYRHKSRGETEELLDGVFYAVPDSNLQDATISFGEADEISTVELIAGSSFDRGVYRVEGDAMLLSFDDGKTDTAQIFERSVNGIVTGFYFNDCLFEKRIREEYASAPLATEPACILYASPPPPPPCPPTTHPIPQPTATSPTAAPSTPPQTVRDFGSRRGNRP